MHFRIFPGALPLLSLYLVLRPLLCFLNGAIGVRLTLTYDMTWLGWKAGRELTANARTEETVQKPTMDASELPG